MIDAALETVQHRQGHQCRHAGQQIAREFLFDEAGQHRRQPFGRLQHHVADETVANNNVSRALEDIVALDIAVEVQMPARRRKAQQFTGLLDDLVPLDRLFADVEQPHRRVFLAVHGRRQRAAHHGKLKQVFGAAVDVGPQVEHGRESIALIGQHRRNRRAVDAFQRLQHVT